MLFNAVKAQAPVSNVAEGTEITRHTKGGKTRVEKHHKIINALKLKKIKSDTVTKVMNSVTAGQAYHASMVEFGSIHNTPNPFMRRALDASQPAIIAAMSAALNKQLIKRGA